ncbi:MAG: M48 family metalloprotease [Cyanobacteria bacterium J06614_10]
MTRFKSRVWSRFLAVLLGILLAIAPGIGIPVFSQIENSQAEDVLSPDDTAVESADTDAPDAPESVEAETSSETPSVEETENNPEADETDVAEEDKPISEADRISRKLILQADREYEAGNFAAAEALYREAKTQSWLLPFQFSSLPPEAFSDESLLTPAGAVYWREAKAGIANDRPSQTLTALSLLTSEFPEFTPGIVQYATVLLENEQPEEARAVLEEALTIYPANSDLLLAQVDLMMAKEEWLEATIASRQFVALNSEHAAAPAQSELAAENLNRFQRETRSRIRNDAIANVFTGVLGYALTGSIFGPFTAANSAVMLLQGENAIGNQYANQIAQRLPMVQHPEALAYVRQLGNQLARATGRNDLDYEFFVILDPNLNAFALPGGKIFVNAGAILDTQSEAELAGLLAHELAHAVLSHGFQIATQGNLTSSIAQYLPYGGLINNVFLSGYSRRMERQADIVGTQILSASGYAADGVYNVMVTLNEQAAGRNAPTWLSTHPNPADRVDYLKALVERGGYNRYAYEGIANHEEIQAIVARELAAYEAEQTSTDADAEESAEETVDEAVEEHTQTENLDAEGTNAEPVDLYDAVEKFDW